MEILGLYDRDLKRCKSMEQSRTNNQMDMDKEEQNKEDLNRSADSSNVDPMDPDMNQSESESVFTYCGKVGGLKRKVSSIIDVGENNDISEELEEEDNCQEIYDWLESEEDCVTLR